jgi:septal ring factor EnvC (AmiA/AmiB activator)
MNQTSVSERGAKSGRSARIERVVKDIDKTKEKIAELQAKLRALEQQKIEYENEEIIAMFRKEKLTECDLAAYIKSRRETEPGSNTASPPGSNIRAPKEDGPVE